MTDITIHIDNGLGLFLVLFLLVFMLKDFGCKK